VDPSTLSSAGFILQAGGVLNSAVGSFYAAKSQRYQLKSQALAVEFQADMARLNARAAAAEADRAMMAGQRQIGQYTMQAGAQKAHRRDFRVLRHHGLEFPDVGRDEFNLVLHTFLQIGHAVIVHRVLCGLSGLFAAIFSRSVAPTSAGVRRVKSRDGASSNVALGPKGL